jgi:ABC-type nitrate/sulfonate/bicarbonate transport system substrate-binding protein
MTIRVERILEVKIAKPRLVALLRFVCRLRCGCILAIGILLFSAPAPAQELKKIVVAYVAPSEQMILPMLAQQTGIFRKHGLDAQTVLVSGSTRIVQSLIAGNFDYAMAGVTPIRRSWRRSTITRQARTLQPGDSPTLVFCFRSRKADYWGALPSNG